jgi:cytolysin-activating lysine-acyltransferase
MLDQVINLMTFSDIHKVWTVDQVNRCIVPPVNLKQCTGIIEDGYLVAWVSWAFMSEEIGDKFLDGAYTMQPESWRSGDRLILMDLIAPFQHTHKLVKIVRQLFPEYPKAEWRRHTKQRRFGVAI